MGAGFNTAVHNPEDILPKYDLVFAKARCALEALCVGCAVVLCDFPGTGPMVTVANFESLRRMNFGRGALTNALDPSFLVTEMSRYDPQDAAEVSQQLRSLAGLSTATGDWLALYSDVIAEFKQHPHDPCAERRAFERYLHWRETDPLQRRARRMERIRKIPFVGKSVMALTHRTLEKLN
jgi:hypothetical protein